MIDVKILDCFALGMDWKGLEKVLEREEPDVVGVGAITCYVEEAARVLQLAKRANHGVVTVVGGSHFTFTADESLRKYRDIDYIVMGEGEHTLLELISNIEKNRSSASKIKGLAYREGGEVIYTPSRALIDDLDELPFPAWDLLPMDRYRLVVWGSRLVILVSSRGCPFNCTFCSERVFGEGGGGLRVRKGLLMRWNWSKKGLIRA